MTTCAIYARVSTDDKEQNPESQLLRCREFATGRGYTITKTYLEYHTGDSKASSRPVFKTALDTHPDIIVVWSIDRFSRQEPVSVITELRDLKENYNVKVIPVQNSEIFDMDGPFGSVMQYLMHWFSNYYLANLKEATRRGLEHARRNGTRSGKPIGRPSDSERCEGCKHTLLRHKPISGCRSCGCELHLKY